MDETINLTIDQLNFITDLTAKVASCPEFKDRLKACISGISTNRPTEITLLHSPQKMIDFLSLFSRSDKFKWYTHKWDSPTSFDIDTMKLNQKADKSILSNMAYPKESGPAVNENTYNQVWNFINFSNCGKSTYTWTNTSFEEIKYGWHTIVDLCKSNPDTSVEDLKLANGRQFKDYVRMFKTIIEFRTDLEYDSRFSSLIRKSIKSRLKPDLEVTFSEEFNEIGYDLSVYCDVIGVLMALNIICDWIIRYKTRGAKVNVDLISNNEYYILKIFHEGSYFDNKKKLKNPTGDFDKLRKRLFSVCDLIMKGDYKNDGETKTTLTVNALCKSTKKTNGDLTACHIKERENKKIGGVVYELKIYK